MVVQMEFKFNLERILFVRLMMLECAKMKLPSLEVLFFKGNLDRCFVCFLYIKGSYTVLFFINDVRMC